MTEAQIASSLPAQATRFVGREEDLAKIVSMLTEPSCRLITLVGPGGIGKTRLAVQAASEASGSFSSGVHLVALHVVRSVDSLIAAIIDTLKLQLQGHEPPIAQLLRHLRDRELLLILDNFEHLLDAVDLLLQILDTAPQVKILVTSREVLNLRQEWVWPVTGMRFPDDPDSDSAEDYGAVRLFVECAHRARPDFSLRENQANVIRICQIVDGVPLALELAASWLKSLPCSAIVTEIQRNLDFLDTRLRDLPARHRSIRAVFNESWSQLSPDEQNVFSQLTIFRGGFRRETAEQVVGATLPLLSALMDKSLIRIDSSGRYQIHELLHQFASEKLDEQPDLRESLHARHCAYYADFLAKQPHSDASGQATTAAGLMLEETDNISAAWYYALSQCSEAILDPFLVPLYRVLNDQNRFYDGERIFRLALNCLRDADGVQSSLTQARAGLCLALCLQNLTHYDESFELLQSCLPTLEAHNAAWELWSAQACLAIIAYSRGDYVSAQRHFEQVREMLKDGSSPSALVITLSHLSDIAGVRGDYHTAKRFLSEAIALLDASGGERGRIRFLVTLGDIEHKLGNYEKAETHFQAALDLSRSQGNAMTSAISLVSLGRVAHAIEDFSLAKTRFREGIALFDEVRHLWGKSFALAHLGRACVELEQFDEAYRHFSDATLIAESTGSQWLKALCYYNQGWLHFLLGRRDSAIQDLHGALQIAGEIETVPLILEILAAAADAAAAYGYEAWAVSLACYVAQNPLSEYTTHTQVERLLQRLNHEPAAVPEIPVASLVKTVLSAMLEGFETVAPPFHVASSRSQPSLADDWLEHLTERELEILRLLAEGRSNQEIAERLILVLGTVKAHNHNIFSKLGAKNRVQAITRARELGLI